MHGLGLIGAGRIGIIHGVNAEAHPGSRLVALTDANPAAAESLARRTGAAVRSTEGIIGAPDIDAILICSPTDTHADLIEQAAQAGKAIFCEKPIDLSLDRVRRAVAAAEAAKVPLMIAFQRRFDPHLQALEKQLREGVIGQIEIITITSRDPAPPPVGYVKRSGGLYRDSMIHVWTPPLAMAFCLPRGSVAFMCPACMCGAALAAGLDGNPPASSLIKLARSSGALNQTGSSRRWLDRYASRTAFAISWARSRAQAARAGR